MSICLHHISVHINADFTVVYWLLVKIYDPDNEIIVLFLTYGLYKIVLWKTLEYANLDR